MGVSPDKLPGRTHGRWSKNCWGTTMDERTRCHIWHHSSLKITLPWKTNFFVFVINKWTSTFHLSHKQAVQLHLSQKQVDLKSDQTNTQQTFCVGGSVKWGVLGKTVSLGPWRFKVNVEPLWGRSREGLSLGVGWCPAPSNLSQTWSQTT